MASINIYVSAEMRTKMAERPEINWSAVANQAFESALAKPRRDVLAIATKPAVRRATLESKVVNV